MSMFFTVLALMLQTYTVQPGDYLTKIAPKYGVSWQTIASINHLANPNLIYPGQVLTIIPDTLQAPVTPPSVTLSTPVQLAPVAPTRATYNPGYPGSCVWYIFDQRPDIYGLAPYPNAWQLTGAAAQAGYHTGQTPISGAVVVFMPGIQGALAPWGHAAIVTSVNADGSFWISEMNSYRIGSRIVWPGNGVSFIYWR